MIIRFYLKNYINLKGKILQDVQIIVNHINEIFAADLVEMQKFSKINKGYRYLLTCIDIFSQNMLLLFL